MSRYDYRDPGTDPAYCDGLDWRNDVTRDSDPADQEAAGIDVPDFDAPEPPVDPAEVAAYALLTSLHAFELEVFQVGELDRAQLLKKLSKQAFDIMNRIDLRASAKIDEILERRR